MSYKPTTKLEHIRDCIVFLERNKDRSLQSMLFEYNQLQYCGASFKHDELYFERNREAPTLVKWRYGALSWLIGFVERQDDAYTYTENSAKEALLVAVIAGLTTPRAEASGVQMFPR